MERADTPDLPSQYPLSRVIGVTVIIVIGLVILDLVQGRDLQPVGYAIWLILGPPALLAGRAIYIRRMRRRARRR